MKEISVHLIENRGRWSKIALELETDFATQQVHASGQGRSS